MTRSAQKKQIPLWKKLQKEKKKKKTLRTGLLLFLVLSGAVVFRNLRLLVVRAGFSLEDQKCFAKQTKLSQTNRVNIVFDEEPLLLVSFDQDAKIISALGIPKDFYLKKETEVYRLGSFFELGEMRDGCGGRFLKKSLLSFLALPIDRYFKVDADGESINSREELAAKIKKIQTWGWLLKSVFEARGGDKGWETDLSPKEIFRLWRELRKIREDRIFFRTLSQGIALEEDQLIDGTPIEVIAGDFFFEEVVGFFEDSRLAQEGIEVAVFNTLSSPGLGQRGGYLVAHLGAELTHVGNWPEKMATTQIWVVKPEAENSATLRRLADVFQAEVIRQPEVAELRGELMVFLGQDWGQ